MILDVGPDKTYQTVQSAVEAAENGDIIQIYEGTYFSKEPVIIAYKEWLTILGQGHALVTSPSVFRGNDYLPVIAVYHSKNISINNLHAMHDPATGFGECGGPVILIENSINVNVEGCELNGCGGYGVFAVASSEIVIKTSYIHHNSLSAFYLNNCSFVTIKNNRIEDNDHMLVEVSVNGLEINDNTIENVTDIG